MLLFTDRVSVQSSRRVYTEQGFLKVPGRVARPGIQQYLASELELTDRDPNAIVNVFRPPEEVFAPESLATYEDADITVDHLGEVTSDNFKRYTAGHATEAGQEVDGWVEVPLLFKDKAAIEVIEKGTDQLSAGYKAIYVREPGTFNGTPYEFKQQRIRVNHIALVENARAGSEARVLDHKPTTKGAKPMLVKLPNGVTVEVADAAAASTIQSIVDEQANRLKTSDASYQEMKDEKEKLQAQMDALEEKMKEAEEKTSADSVGKAVQAVLHVQKGAALIAGKEFICDSFDPLAIKRAALAVRYPKRDFADKSESYLLAAFDAAVEEKEAEDEEETEGEKNAEDSRRKFAQSFNDSNAQGKLPVDPVKIQQDSYNDYVNALINDSKPQNA